MKTNLLWKEILMALLDHNQEIKQKPIYIVFILNLINRLASIDIAWHAIYKIQQLHRINHRG